MWWLAATALAQSSASVGDDELAAMVADLYPEVAAEVGRAPVGRLHSGILTRERLAAALRLPIPTVGTDPDRHQAGRGLPWLADRDAWALSHGTAVYVPSLRGVYVVKESVEGMFSSGALGPEQLRPVLRCVLAHELTHALQDVYGADIPEDEDRGRGYVALVEGHATVVERRLCSAWEGAGTAQILAGGSDMLATTDPGDPEAPYALGSWLVERLRAEDPELVWAALAGDPPRWSDILADVVPVVSAGWQDPAPVLAAAGALGVASPSAQATGPHRLAWLFGGLSVGTPPASAGWIVEGPGILVAAFRMDDPGGSAALLDLRRKAMLTPFHANVAVPVQGAMTGAHTAVASKSLRERPDVRSSLVVRFAIAGAVPYVERWVATDRVAVLVATQDTAANRAADAAIAALLDALPAAAPPADAPLPHLDAWIAGLRERRAAVAHLPSPDWRLATAGEAWKYGNTAPCADAFADALAPGAVPDVDPFAAGELECALRARDLPLALSAASGLHSVDGYLAAWTADAFRAGDHVDEALALLDKAVPASPRDAEHVADARLRALDQLGRWSDLAALARGAEGSPDQRVRAAVDLRRAGRGRDATAILVDACPKIPDPPAVCRGP